MYAADSWLLAHIPWIAPGLLPATMGSPFNYVLFVSIQRDNQSPSIDHARMAFTHPYAGCGRPQVEATRNDLFQ